jgi:hypothetical protein
LIQVARAFLALGFASTFDVMLTRPRKPIQHIQDSHILLVQGY